jgi:hypothetical protein
MHTIESVQLVIMERSMPVPESGCWIWTGGCTGAKHRYGICIRFGERLAHRVSWRAFRGAIPVGLFVLHKCDTPSCVNPDHLWLGTIGDNTRDMYAKGRGNKGGSAGFESPHYTGKPVPKMNVAAIVGFLHSIENEE